MALAADELIRALRSTRDDYNDELAWHRFLLDAYAGTGGFAGRVQAPETGYLGWAAEAYGNSALILAGHGADCDTYLDRYPREDDAKFQRRKDVAHYTNYVEAILDILVSYVTKNEMLRDNTPEQITEWMVDADGQGSAWDDLLNDVVKPRTALLGWAPMLFDSPRAPADSTRAATNAAGVRARAIPLFPANLLDWEVEDDGSFAWAKIRIEYWRRPDPLGPRTKEEHYLLLKPATVTRHIVIKTDGGETVSAPEVTSHGFGAVPVVIWRHKPCAEDTVRGTGMVDAVAVECRRLFNLVSELDEHLRQQVFALLQVPYAGPDPPTELIGGTDNAVGLPADAKHEYKWLAPPATVAETFEQRIDNTTREIYRLARVEYEVATGQAESGLSRAYQFERTNRRLGDFAKQLARAEKRCYAFLGRALGVSPTSVEQASVTAPTDFRVEDLAADIKNALDAISLTLPPTAEMWVKKRVIEKMLPNLPDEQVAEIMDELEKQREETVSARAEQAEMRKAALETAKNGDGSPVDGGKGESTVPQDEAA